MKIRDTIHPDGIYFDLPNDIYHSDPALGSTDIKGLASDPIEYQYEKLHTTREETKALVFGQLLHARILEGRNAPFDYLQEQPELLQLAYSGKLMSEYLDNKGRPKPKRIVDRAEAIIKERDIANPLWDNIETAAKWMQQDPTLGEIMKDGTLVEGQPEVSMFCTINGVRRKARFDRLLGHAAIDLKSFAPVFGEKGQNAVTKSISKYRYDLQAAAYIEVWRAGRTLWQDGKVFGSDHGLLEKVYSKENPMWIWVFVKSTGAPQSYVRPFQMEGSEIFDIATREVTNACNIYKENTEKYGADKDWVPFNPPENIQDNDFPPWHGR